MDEGTLWQISQSLVTTPPVFKLQEEWSGENIAQIQSREEYWKENKCTKTPNAHFLSTNLLQETKNNVAPSDAVHDINSNDED